MVFTSQGKLAGTYPLATTSAWRRHHQAHNSDRCHACPPYGIPTLQPTSTPKPESESEYENPKAVQRIS